MPRVGVEARVLSSIAFWVLGPAFVFNLFAESTLSTDLIVRLAAAGIVGMAAAGIAAALANGVVGSSRSVSAASVMTSAYGNVGNAGLAITAFALGDEALAAAGVLMLTVNLSGISLGVTLAAGQSKGRTRAVIDGLRTPMTIAAGLAVLSNVTDIAPPLALERSIQLLAGAMIPIMLLGLGAQLARTTITSRPGHRFSFITADLAISTVAKLLIAPTAAAATAIALGLDGAELGAVVLQSAMPPAVFCLAVALEHDLEPDRVTTAVVGMTVASLATLPVVLLLVT